MDHGPDKGDDDVTDDLPSRPEPSVPSTGGVRIIGAETAAEITSELPVVPPAHIIPDASTHASVRILEEPTPSRPPSRSRMPWRLRHGTARYRHRPGTVPGTDRTSPLDRAADRSGSRRPVPGRR